MFNEPIHVLGAGSIGLLWTASIRSKFPTYPITLLLRDHQRSRERVRSRAQTQAHTQAHTTDHYLDIAWNNRQLHPDHQNQQISLPVQFINNSSNTNHEQNHEQEQQERIKTLIVATKAHQAKQAVESVMDRLLPVANTDASDSVSSSSSPEQNKNTQIIVLCNGAISVREELSEILHNTNDKDAISLVLATTTHGAYLPEPDQLIHAGVGTTFLDQQHKMPSSSPPSSLDGMVNLWNIAGLNCTYLSSRQINSMLWNKLAANCVINPLTSIFRCTNGELLLEPSFHELQEDILKEVAHVAAAGATHTAEVEETGEGIKNNNIASIPSIDEMRKFVTQTILKTRDNKSSMYQDIIKGQQTEIEHLNGFVVRKGREMGKDCPANEDLRSRIAELTSQNRNR